MGQVIKNTKEKLSEAKKESTAMDKRPCNYRRKEDCPVGTRCLEENVV